MNDLNQRLLIQKINKKLAENDYRIFQKTCTCTCRTGSIINLNDFTFQEIFDYVAEDCGFGNGEEEWDFIGDVKKAKELENACPDWCEATQEDIDKYEDKKYEIFSSLKSSDIEIPICDWELIRVSEIDDIEYHKDNEGIDYNLVYIAQTPQKERRYKSYLVYNIDKDDFEII